MNSCFLQLLGEKTGRVERNRWGEGRGTELKEYFLPFYQLCQEGEFAGFQKLKFFFCLLATGSSPTAIAALTSTVNRTTTNLQPLVPIGTQLQQPQFQVRMVQFPQQSGPAQIQQTIVQSPRGATTPVQIHTQQAQVVQGLQQVCQRTMGLLMSNGRYLHFSVG